MTIDQILAKYKGKIGNRNRINKRTTVQRSNPFKTGIDVELDKKSSPFSIRHGTKHLYVGVKVFYEKYLTDLSAGEDLPNVTIKQYRGFLKLYFRLMLDKILNDGFIFIWPYYLGRFYFRKSNRRGYSTRYKIFMRNLHSFRKFFNVKWDKQLAYFKNRTVWKFVPNAKTKREYAQRVYDSIDIYDPKPIIAHDHNESKWT